MEFRALLHEIDDSIIEGYFSLLHGCASPPHSSKNLVLTSLSLPCLILPKEPLNLIPENHAPAPTPVPSAANKEIPSPVPDIVEEKRPLSMRDMVDGAAPSISPPTPTDAPAPAATPHSPTLDPDLLSSLVNVVDRTNPLEAPVRVFQVSAESVTHLLRSLEKFKSDVTSLWDRVEALISRLKKGILPDANGGRPRYGTSTVRKHVFLIRRYHAVWRLLNSDEILSAVKILQQLALEKANREEAARELEQKMEEERLRVERELVQAEEIERVRRREEEDELRRIAEAREASARLEAERDRALQSSVRLGVEGMKHSLEILKKNTVGLEGQDDIQAMVSAEEYRNALCSLHKLVEQMVKHPEEEKYRRIRRDHEGFLTDIGRFEGGIEFLIATGFFFTMVEGIKSLVCREPNLETQLDAWSAWYDRLKLAITILDEEIAKQS